MPNCFVLDGLKLGEGFEAPNTCPIVHPRYVSLVIRIVSWRLQRGNYQIALINLDIRAFLADSAITVAQ